MSSEFFLGGKRRGFLHVFEVVFAITMMVVLATTIYPPTARQDRIGGYRHMGFQALEYLDGASLLRQSAVLNDPQAIEQELRTFFPPEVGYSVEVCDVSGACTNANVPDADTAVGAYYIAGNGTYSPREVRLYLWLK